MKCNKELIQKKFPCKKRPYYIPSNYRSEKQSLASGKSLIKEKYCLGGIGGSHLLQLIYRQIL